jgi:hypothetical protein
MKFIRDNNVGEYIRMCRFSKTSRYIVLNSIIQSTDFNTEWGKIYLYDIKEHKFKISNYGIYLRLMQSMYEWPNVYNFDEDDQKFIYLQNINNKNLIFIHDLTNNTRSGYIYANCSYPTAIAINDNYIIWKEPIHGNITVCSNFDVSQNLYNTNKCIILSTKRASSDGHWYKNPNVITKDNYIISGSYNDCCLYLFNIETQKYKCISRWVGENILIENDYILYNTFNQLRLYDIVNETKTFLTSANNILKMYPGHMFGEFVLITYENKLAIYDIVFNVTASEGIWNRTLTDISFFTNGDNVIYSLDEDNNLLAWHP